MTASQGATERLCLRAAGYGRVSTAEQATDGFSLHAQEHSSRAYAEGQGWEFGEMFTDPGVRGSVPFASRAGGMLALKAARGVDRLIVWRLDRLGRNAADILATIQRLEDVGCAVVSVSESIDTASTHGRLMRTMIAGFAEFERDTISERVKEGERSKARKGRPHGGRRPYGYRYDSGLVVVASEAVIVVRIFTEFVDGKSITAIARGLQRDQVPTVHGGPWRQGTVSGILRNVRYIGKVDHAGDVFDGEHEPIVDQERFARAQHLLSGQTSSRAGRPPKGRHLFRGGFLRCHCGEAMVPRTRDRYEMYYCSGRAKFGMEFCSMPAIRRHLVDEPVYAFFEHVGLDLEATKAQLAERRNARLAEVAARRLEADRQAAEVAEQLTRIRRDYRDGKLDAADWRSFRDELTAELQAAQAEVDHLEAQHAQLDAEALLDDAEQQVLDALTDIRRRIAGEIEGADGIDAVRAALRRLFEPFVLCPSSRDIGHTFKFDDNIDFGIALHAGPDLQIELVPRRDVFHSFAQIGDDVIDEYGAELVLDRQPVEIHSLGLPIR